MSSTNKYLNYAGNNCVDDCWADDSNSNTFFKKIIFFDQDI